MRRKLDMQLSRRSFLLGSTAVLAAGMGAEWMRSFETSRAAEGTFEVTLTEAEWKAKLSPQAFEVLRHEATEYPGTSELLDEHRPGIFSCAGCDLPLFDASTKFESGTGWPSFYQPLENAVGESTDFKLGYARTEVHCRRCGGHLGHVFDDGPPPTGLRYCMNGVSLKFTPSA
jgi:peptide-methionine (R)-S-oxide reductase